MTTRLSEIAQRLAAARSAPRVPLPVDCDKDCWVQPGMFVAASRELALMYSSAPKDIEFLLEQLRGEGMITVSKEIKRRLLDRATNSVITAVVAGFTTDPGTSDLYDEQPIWVHMTLGDYRRAARLLHDLTPVEEKAS